MALFMLCSRFQHSGFFGYRARKIHAHCMARRRGCTVRVRFMPDIAGCRSIHAQDVPDAVGRLALVKPFGDSSNVTACSRIENPGDA
jgi:hypothetical protein